MKPISVLSIVLAGLSLACSAVSVFGQQGTPSQVPASAPPAAPATLPAASAPSAPPAAVSSASVTPAPNQPSAGALATASASAKPSNANAAGGVREREAQIAEGEKRFATNCSRCHQFPHKFPPRVMATAIRHMRVRATITDEDMHLILLYMTQ
jgi:hypothetical protein